MKTADLYDRFEAEVQVAEPMLFDFGGVIEFSGPIATLKIFEDNALVRKRLQEKGEGRVLVIDGAASPRTALVGDQLATLGVDNGWAGLVIHGCIRDVEALAELELGVKALGSTPRKAAKRGTGDVDVPVCFAGVTFTPGQWLYADADGILVAPHPLTL